MVRLIPRKRTILGGVLAVGIAAGLYLGAKLPHIGSGFGLGQGGDGVIGSRDISEVAVKAEVTGKSVSQPDDRNKAETSSDRSLAPKRIEADPLDDALTILVEDRHYAVWKKTRKGNGYFPVDVSEIVDLARNSQPNDDGIRVRILRTRSARVSAWQPLQSELVKAGIRSDEILVPKELIND